MNLRNISLVLCVVLLISVIGVIAEINTTGNDAISTNVSDNIDQNNISINDSETDTKDLFVDNLQDKIISSTPDGVVVDISRGSDHVVERRDSCVDEKYVELVPQFGNCSRDVTVCDDAPLNQSCHVEKQLYDCYISDSSVEKIAHKCKTKGYKISKYSLDTSDYVCNVDTSNKDSTVIICDSRYDGNGDGICTSGESCMKYIIDKDSIVQYEKNSKDEYQPSDDSYFLNRINTEVEE